MIQRPLFVSVAAIVASASMLATPSRADKLLDEAVGFTGVLAFLGAKVPGFVIAAVRDGETSFSGFGEIADGTGKAPDGDTIMRIGSISKVFCGSALASLVADDTVSLTDKLQDRLGYDVTVPEKDGKTIRLIDLVTHSSGLPREVPRPAAPDNDPFGTNTKEAQIAGLAGDPLLFPPQTGALYSNYGFDLLGAALANVSGKSYAALLEERIFGPLGMKDSIFNPRPGDEARLMQGHNFDGSPMPTAPTPTTIECAGGLYTTPNDMLRWMQWHLVRFSATDQEMRLLDHAAYLYRDGLDPAFGFDEGGPMDAIGLGWIVMLPEGDRPLILQKTGGLQGMFAYVALAPTRGVGVFIAMNEFNIGGLEAAIAAATNLISELAPR